MEDLTAKQEWFTWTNKGGGKGDKKSKLNRLWLIRVGKIVSLNQRLILQLLDLWSKSHYRNYIA